MSNALEQASLIMVPSGYEDGTLGSLKPTDGSGDFTFSRGSNTSATRVNADGYIEKGYENLLLQSNSFDTTWLSVNADAPTGGQAGYDGSNDAWLLNSTGTEGRVTQSVSQGGVQSFSVYAKANTNNWICIIALTSPIVRANFDLNPSTLGNRIGVTGNNIDASIEDIGNGWFRCSVTYNATITGVNIYSIVDDNIFTGTGSIYIQDAMLNQGLVAYPYIETTTAPVAGGILEDMPRLDYSNGSCPALLLEPERTNIVEKSEYFDYLLNGDAIDLDYNNLISPEGYVNAVKCTPRAVSALNRLEYQVTLSVPKTYTFSMFAKENGYDYFLLRFVGTSAGSVNASFNLTTGEKDYTSSGIESTIEPYANGWYRLSVTMSVTSSLLRVFFRPQPSPQLDDSIGVYTGNGTSGCYIYGLQMEQDATYPTSYIPTYGVSQTRLADFFDSNADFTNFFGDNQGTIYIETDKRLFKNLSANVEFIGFRDDTKYWRIIGSQSVIFIQCNNWGSTIAHYPSTTNPTKYLFKWDGSNVSFYIDGSLIGSATQTATFNPNQFGRAGNGVGMDSQELLNQFTLFPTALSDEECIALTTI